MDSITNSLKLIIIALLRRNNGEIVLDASELNSIDLESEIELTTTPKKKIILKEIKHETR